MRFRKFFVPSQVCWLCGTRPAAAWAVFAARLGAARRADALCCAAERWALARRPG